MKEIFKDSSTYYLLIFATVLIIIGCLAYKFSTHNRSIFSDIPDRSKVARRIIEIIEVFIAIIFLCYIVSKVLKWYIILFIAIPLICFINTVGVILTIIDWQNTKLIPKPQIPKSKKSNIKKNQKISSTVSSTSSNSPTPPTPPIPPEKASDYEIYSKLYENYINEIKKIRSLNRKKIKNPQSKKFKEINEQIINSVILVLFMLSGCFVILITIAMFIDKSTIVFLSIILNMLLSFEFSCLSFQLYYLITKQIPKTELEVLTNIAKELND
ncbi:MAG: hypothetical protein LBM93_14005 [Oscillospiraceae bacterium]|jgi:hypothetical protein|nr:hypothetical protein [Oscillospiraceae bacterium]